MNLHIRVSHAEQCLHTFLAIKIKQDSENKHRGFA